MLSKLTNKRKEYDEIKTDTNQGGGFFINENLDSVKKKFLILKKKTKII